MGTNPNRGIPWKPRFPIETQDRMVKTGQSLTSFNSGSNP